MFSQPILSTEELNLPLKILKGGAVAPSSDGTAVGLDLLISLAIKTQCMRTFKINSAKALQFRLKSCDWSEWQGWEGEQLVLFSYLSPCKSSSS